MFAFDGAFLADALGRIGNDNAKGEYYLTDVVHIARADGRTVGAHRIDDVMQTEGANDRAQLAGLAAELNRRVLDRWMREGVTVVDPTTTWVDSDVVLERDVTILPGRAAARRDRGGRGRGRRPGLHAQGRRGRPRAPRSCARTASWR